MKKWAFVSDFDGTISTEDFYWKVIHQCFPEGHELYKKWKANELQDIGFLRTVFASINKSEQQIIDMIHSIQIDDYVPAFIKNVQRNGGDFIILSAGTDYYIDCILKKYEIENVDIYANEGVFKDNNVQMNIEPSHWHYSDRYGIDKSKVIQKLKEEYEVVYFIGDSEPDSHAAIHADLTFAKGALQDLLSERSVPFIAVEKFIEVEKYLMEKGLIAKK